MFESDQERVLVTVTGPDTPGITAALTGVLASKGARLLDIEQVVVQGQLTLCLLVGLDSAPGSGEPVLKDLLFTAKRMGLDLDFAVVSPDQNGHAGQSRYAVTAIGDGLDAGGVHVIADVLARHGANIEQIRQLSGERLGSLEIIVGLPPEPGLASTLRRDLIRVTADLNIDVAVQHERLTRRAKRLVIMDMDSTLIRIEVIDELAAMHGVGEQVSEITRRAMGGELDFEQSLRERVGLLRGLSVEKVHALAADLPITEGAREMLRVLRKLGFKTGVISGGFTFAAYALKDKLGLDYAYANELVEADGVLTGEVKQPVVSPQRKADLLDAIAQREGIALEQTIAIGDGANDLAMLERAGLGIAFHAKPRLREQADTALRAGGLDRILYLLGLHAHDIAELLAD